MSKRPILVVALGGNALLRAGDEPSFSAQLARTTETAERLTPIVASGRWRIVITHGNGPQVGNALLRSDLAAEAHQLPRDPLDAAVAETQGSMGYVIQQCMTNALWAAGLNLPVTTIVTRVIVDDDDPAFANPTKPIGRFYPEGELERLRAHGWTLEPDPQGRGWRRVVPSPVPREIVERDLIKTLVDDGSVVVACGGGGIPVVPGEDGSLHGCEAVIDKDLASALLATTIGADTLAIATDVDRIYLNFGTTEQSGIDRITSSDLSGWAAENHFPEGSMGPKVRGILEFLQAGGRAGVVTNPENLEAALEDRVGTRIIA